MKLIDRYITEVGKHLPRKNRADIQTEIQSTLEDMLEDRAKTSGRPLDDVLIKEVLKEYGSPDKIALSYLPERYLIGPRLFPIFTLVLKIVLSVLTVMALIGFGIRFGTSAHTFQDFNLTFGKSLVEYLGGIMSAFGNIVFIFAILQRALPASEFEDEEKQKDWDPASLEQEPEPDEVSIWTPIWSIVVTIAALLVFNLYPQMIGIGFLDGGKWTFVPALSNAFFRYLPLIDVLWVLQIGLNIILLRQAAWTTLTRWFEVALTIMSIVITYLLLKGPSLMSLSAEALNRVILDPEAAATIIKIFSIMTPVTLLIILVLESIDLFKNVYRLVFKPKNDLPIRVK
ncbi:MAG TPA: hypothetical protein VGK00_13855 [Anaerolineales bacterium]|jgi:hypothetical protein